MKALILTAEVMVKRSVGNVWLLWLCGFLPAAAAVISPAETLPGKLVSLTAFLPGVLLLTGWHGSRARKGLMAILFRTEGAGAVRDIDRKSMDELRSIFTETGADAFFQMIEYYSNE